ncbi:unnamed protein product [Arabidopsis lyrata]|uniref:Uncharacterized protein n=1 Tax=Arabidopsis lyrata subsp. lyrata TaxID=81972 RepID=D7LTC5_ARALL|nr:uncharacterized protein LOC9314559 [Arabidopsis lyrata subsp. lyrata]EFH54750.1 hypothetical protein ARALYDRAFT_486808 [Arabidopsis lyrata subsp. lyrata]CAH8269562.1 unnamed protein product [Arabidopsis lyrata]|eukprot:XP_002878491.1 uncharacterized protein LOC9314559 [Arabidopsis lyrata subsp. lyrata]
MQRGKDDDKRGIFRRLLRLVVVKLMKGHKEDRSVTKKLIKKESKSDITIYFKQREDSEDNANPINFSRSSEKERVIMLVNGSNGSKKNLASELSVRRSVAQTGAGMTKPKPLFNDINTKSHAFIESRLAKMRKGL